MPILQASHLVKQYGGRTVVNGVSFEVNKGQIVGLLGRNGAGKTTSFRMSIGMIKPDGGSVRFLDEDVTSLPMFERARLGVGYLPQERSIFGKLSVAANLMMILETTDLQRRERRMRCEALLEQFDLAKCRKQAAGTVSGGERRKLEIARCLIHQPKVILLDEPFAAVDPVAVEELQEEIRRLRDESGIAIFITDHNVPNVLSVCEHVYVQSEGKIFAEGTPKDIINNDLVRRTYLGNTFRGDEFDDAEHSADATHS